MPPFSTEFHFAPANRDRLTLPQLHLSKVLTCSSPSIGTRGNQKKKVQSKHITSPPHNQQVYNFYRKISPPLHPLKQPGIMDTHNIVVFGGDHCGPEVCSR